jgi:hypothetical protein
MNRARRLAASALCAAIAFPSVSHAACVQRDFVGEWTAYFSTTVGTDTSVAVCFFQILRGRPTVIRDGICLNSSSDASTLSRARVRLDSSARCLFSGQADVTNTEPPETARYAFTGTLTREKYIAFGAGTIEGGGTVTFDMAKTGPETAATDR